jgi:hypothetical protein
MKGIDEGRTEISKPSTRISLNFEKTKISANLFAGFKLAPAVA